MRISVVIPASNDCKINALDSLKSQEKKPFEVLVERGDNTSRNRNNGIRKARGDLIAFANAHSVFPQDWTRNIEEFFSLYPQIEIVGGPQLTPKENGFFGKVSGVALSSMFGAANVRSRYSAGQMNLNANEEDITSANLICKKNVFEKVLFDEKIYPGEDPKFISDAKKANISIAYSPKIINYNKRRDNLHGMIKQMFNYGRMRPRKEKLRETLKHPLFLVPSLFVVYLFFLISSSIFYNQIIFFIPLIIYLILDLIFSLIGFVKIKKVRSLFYLLVIYPSIHISYGIGLIWGIFKR